MSCEIVVFTDCDLADKTLPENATVRPTLEAHTVNFPRGSYLYNQIDLAKLSILSWGLHNYKHCAVFDLFNVIPNKIEQFDMNEDEHFFWWAAPFSEGALPTENFLYVSINNDDCIRIAVDTFLIACLDYVIENTTDASRALYDTIVVLFPPYLDACFNQQAYAKIIYDWYNYVVPSSSFYRPSHSERASMDSIIESAFSGDFCGRLAMLQRYVKEGQNSQGRARYGTLTHRTSRRRCNLGEGGRSRERVCNRRKKVLGATNPPKELRLIPFPTVTTASALSPSTSHGFHRRLSRRRDARPRPRAGAPRGLAPLDLDAHLPSRGAVVRRVRRRGPHDVPRRRAVCRQFAPGHVGGDSAVRLLHGPPRSVRRRVLNRGWGMVATSVPIKLAKETTKNWNRFGRPSRSRCSSC